MRDDDEHSVIVQTMARSDLDIDRLTRNSGFCNPVCPFAAQIFKPCITVTFTVLAISFHGSSLRFLLQGQNYKRYGDPLPLPMKKEIETKNKTIQQPLPALSPKINKYPPPAPPTPQSANQSIHQSINRHIKTQHLNIYLSFLFFSIPLHTYIHT